MSNPDTDGIAREVAAGLVAVDAPEENDLFPFVADAFFARPEEGSGRKRDDMLGFGVAEVATALAPVALAVSDDLVRYLWSEFSSAMKGEAKTRIQSAVRAVVARLLPSAGAAAHSEPPKALPLTSAQIREIHRRAVTTARQAGLAQSRADALADRLVARLALEAA